MPHQYTVPLKKLIKDLNLQILYYPKTEEEILVSHAELMRPGLAFTGFFQGFVPARINMIGRTELAYLETLPPHLLRQSLEGFLSRSPKAVIITQDFSFRPLFLELAEKYCVPLMQSPEKYHPYGRPAQCQAESGAGAPYHRPRRFDGDLRRGCAAYRGFRRRQK